MPPKWPQRKGAAVAARVVEPCSRNPKVQPRRPALSDGDLEALVGPITETKEAHLARHSGGCRSCPRCRWYARGPDWVRVHGNVRETARAGPRKVVWCDERPARWGGAWAIGCKLCADAVARVQGGSRGAAAPSAPTESGPILSSQPIRRRLGTHWARFEVRPWALQAEHVRQHAESDVHKCALQVFFFAQTSQSA